MGLNFILGKRVFSLGINFLLSLVSATILLSFWPHGYQQNILAPYPFFRLCLQYFACYLAIMGLVFLSVL